MIKCRWPSRSCTGEESSERNGRRLSSGKTLQTQSATAQVNSSRTYMLDGVYQSAICFFMAYLVFAPANFVTFNGLNINDTKRVGVYVGCAAIVVVNIYVLINTYRWDWLMLLLVAISVLLVWFWTGVYTAATGSGFFYKAAPQVFGQLSFWVLTLLTVVICLGPRFAIKAFQKIYLPRDVDIIREQVRQGKFSYLDQYEAYVPPKMTSPASSDFSQPLKPDQRTSTVVADDERPIYPPSVAATGTTHNPRSQNGSDGTDYSRNRLSLDQPTRPSFDRPRPSFDRMRSSMDRIRPSFEASSDFTSAALLTRMESSHSRDNSPSQSQYASPLQSPVRPIHGISSLR